MGYFYLILTIIMDVCGTTCLKLSGGFKILIPSLGVFISYALTFYAFANALKSLHLGYAYATWSACGIAIMTIIGIAFFNEPVTVLKLLSLLFVILGVIGLQIV